MKYLNLVWEMNRRAKIVVDTPVGEIDQFDSRNTVKQGTVYGPVMCGVSTSRVNNIGERVVYTYGPKLETESLVYVDDLNNDGDQVNSEKFLPNCRLLETQKKATVNTDKSGYVETETPYN